MQNKFFRDVIQYGLPVFESRMSSGDNEWVGCFPSNYKSSSVIISSPVDFCNSRNNPDTIRPLCHRTSGVHTFPFLPYSLARQIASSALPATRRVLWSEEQASTQWCLPENLPMTLSTSLLPQHSSGPISPYTLCGLTLKNIQYLKNLQYTPHSSLSNPTSFADTSLCLSLQRSLSLLPLLPSLPTLFTESLVPLQHTGILLRFFLTAPLHMSMLFTVCLQAFILDRNLSMIGMVFWHRVL